MAEAQPTGSEEPPHDVLAAEMFAMPARDPGLQDPEREPHDVLAAEAFAMPSPDPTLHHAPVVLPDDLTGESEAVDVLAAEEFAMPAAPKHPDVDGAGGWAVARPGRRVLTVVLAVAAVLGVALAVRAARRR